MRQDAEDTSTHDVVHTESRFFPPHFEMVGGGRFEGAAPVGALLAVILHFESKSVIQCARDALGGVVTTAVFCAALVVGEAALHAAAITPAPTARVDEAQSSCKSHDTGATPSSRL